jgi:L-threonylcarbamoyladenylate synthase
MEIITNPTQDEIKKAARALKNGHLVAFPTETVYGLGADATNERAVNRIYSVKGRPTDHPLIVHISSIDQLERWAIEIPDNAIKLAQTFWPGPMTMILKRSKLAKNFISGGMEYVGLRVPAHLVANDLLVQFEKIGGLGIVAPSANRFGAVSPTSPDHVLNELKEYAESEDLILNGGACRIGIESTIINCTNTLVSIIRPGAITSKMISDTLGDRYMNNQLSRKIKAPGNLNRHYSPQAKILINEVPKIGEGLIAQNNFKTPKGVIRLLSPSNLEEYASGLYQAMRYGDELNLKTISIYMPENIGLGVAIIDRIKKAAG